MQEHKTGKQDTAETIQGEEKIVFLTYIPTITHHLNKLYRIYKITKMTIMIINKKISKVFHNPISLHKISYSNITPPNLKSIITLITEIEKELLHVQDQHVVDQDEHLHGNVEQRDDLRGIGRLSGIIRRG